uniref:Si:ch211-106f21.1 n=1 Tax=Sinocyclocheilus grahami TaxID=75366 RepID=A0A672MM51_SINGR
MDVSFNLSLSNLSLPVSPTSPPLDLHHPLTTIIIIVCLFILFGGFVTFLAVGCPSGGSWGVDGDCGPADGFSCGQTLSSEPQLKLWKRLGSMRQSFSSTPAFRRPIQPYVAQSRKQSGSMSPAGSKTNDSHTYITIPALTKMHSKKI